jgi:hypothetical protein
MESIRPLNSFERERVAREPFALVARIGIIFRLSIDGRSSQFQKSLRGDMH